MAFLEFFFYDGGVGHLDFVPINAITSEVEMGSSLSEVVEKLSRSPLYEKAFEEAFGKAEIESQQVLHALAQFTVTLVSANSKYDKVLRGEQTFTPAELEGYSLFMKNCSACHSGELFTDNYFHNNGLDENFTKDPGRSVITESDFDLGKFRVPSLRNVTLTPPYMHDGRFKTLEEVLNHYVNGIKYSSTLDDNLIKDEMIGIELSEEERIKVIAFINALTDYEFIKDKRFADPF
jgi:cytochrome c peroxidase